MAESQKNQTEKENIVELKTNIYLLSIIGEVEGHESLGERTKATRYEHILPALARAEEDKSIDGLLILLNTVGGDVEAGLAIAEMIASMRKPAVSLVLGGGHSIGVPARRCSRLFADRAECHHGHSSGAYKRHVHRCCTDVP